MDYIRGANRHQVILFPESVEDYITEENPVRFIDAFVASLDLAELGFLRAQPAETHPLIDQLTCSENHQPKIPAIVPHHSFDL
jgi:hypothetical protein